MDPQVVSPGDGAIDEQILGLLQHHRRLTFLTLAESLPLYTWQALFAMWTCYRWPQITKWSGSRGANARP